MRRLPFMDKVMLFIGAAALGLGVAAALIDRKEATFCPVFMSAIGLVWLVETGYHAFFDDRRRARHRRLVSAASRPSGIGPNESIASRGLARARPGYALHLQGSGVAS